MPHELIKNFLKSLFWSVILFYTTTNHFSIRFWTAVKSELHGKTGNDQLSGWMEQKFQSTSQSQSCIKQRPWSLFGGLLLVWNTMAFWFPVKPLYLRSMLSKSIRCPQNFNACSWHSSTKWAQFFSKITLKPHVTHPMLQNLNVWATKICSSAIFFWPLTNQRPLLQAPRQHFSGKMLPQAAAGRQCFQRFRRILKHDFYTTGINKLISHWQKCGDCKSSYFD